MQESISQRVKMIIDKENLSINAFAKKTGLGQKTVDNMIRRNTDPSYKSICSILDAFPNISSDWLLYGNGNPTSTNHRYKYLPLIPIDAMAGQLSGEDFQIMEYDCERYSIPDFDAADFLVTVSGDSMTPTFMSGDILAVRKVDTSRLWFQWGKPYVIATRQGCIVKRIMPSDKDGFVEIVSDNKEQYPKYDLHSEEIVGIALVIGLVRRL